MIVVSSKDVAKHAGVSQTTVSRVLNTPDLVKQKTKDKVLKAIEKLSYVPDANARSLVQKKTGVITLLSGPLHNPFFVDTTTAIVNYANENGYRVNVHFVNDKKLSEAYSSAIENKVDGMILSCILLDDPIFERLKKMSIPFITYNRKHKNEELFVEIDNEEAGFLAAEHLIQLGHKDIAWVGGPLTVSTFKNRFEGYKKALKKYRIIENPLYIFHTDSSKNDIQKAFETLQKCIEKPTAICSGADSVAFNLMNNALSSGLKIPEDISIIGIDNVDLSNHGAMKLTTVGSITENNLGRLAIEKLIEMIELEKSTCIQITESVKVFLRNTTAKRKD